MSGMCIGHLDKEGDSLLFDAVSVGFVIESSCSDLITSGEVGGSALRLGEFASSAGLTVDRLMILLVELLSILKFML